MPRRSILSPDALRQAAVKPRTVFHRAWEVVFVQRFALGLCRDSDTIAKLKAEARLLRWASALPVGQDWEPASNMVQALVEQRPNPALTHLAQWAQLRIDKEPPHFDGDADSDSDGLFGE